jgi:hypothetical protein
MTKIRSAVRCSWRSFSKSRCGSKSIGLPLCEEPTRAPTARNTKSSTFLPQLARGAPGKGLGSAPSGRCRRPFRRQRPHWRCVL